MRRQSYYSNFISEANKILEDYLLSDTLFWNLNLSAPAGHPSYPRLTLGNQLLFLAFYDAQAVYQQSSSVLREARIQRAEMERIESKWQGHWDQKITHEYKSRLRQWSQTLNDLRNDPPANAPYYGQEIRVRVIIALMQDYLPDENLNQELTELDKRLKRFLEPDAFIWEEDLVSRFPKDQFWYLWGRIDV